MFINFFLLVNIIKAACKIYKIAEQYLCRPSLRHLLIYCYYYSIGKTSCKICVILIQINISDGKEIHNSCIVKLTLTVYMLLGINITEQCQIVSFKQKIFQLHCVQYFFHLMNVE